MATENAGLHPAQYKSCKWPKGGDLEDWSLPIAVLKQIPCKLIFLIEIYV